MRLLVVSHPCVVPVNQQFYAEVERQSGWELTLVAPDEWVDEYGPRVLQRWPGLRGRLLGVPVWRPGDIPLHVYRTFFLSLLRKWRPTAIYMHHEPYASATAQVWLANRLASRCPFGFYSAQNIAKRYPQPFRGMEQLVLRHSDFAFPVSQAVADVLQRKGFTGHLTVLPLGIDPQLYRPHPDAAALREEWKGTTGTCLIGYLGRIAEEKGLQTLLIALSRLLDAPWRLLVAGAGPDEAAFDQATRALGLADRVTRLGSVSHGVAPLFLSALDMLVLPSETRPGWKEQFGRVLIEALACGTPVVGSDSGEIPHVVAATGGGLIFPEGDATALQARLRTAIDDTRLRRRLAESGRAAVLASYTHETLAARFIGTVERARTAQA